MESTVLRDAVWRLFIAIDLSDGARAACARVQAAIRRTGAHVSCPEPAHLHLTLCFLGDTFAARVADVCDVMEMSVASTPPFTLHVGGIGEYGRPGHPRVIWAGIQPSFELSALQERLRLGLIARNFFCDPRPFSPHITLARVRSGRRIAELCAWRAGARDLEVGRIEISQIVLYRSQTDRPRPTYTNLHAARLQPP